MASVQQQPDKISAYYSLVFPSITYYLQTLTVTIGRRCIPANSPSSSSALPQVDIDLGALKSVSRLHADIEYDESEERFVLAVHGRNGAWVDGVWSGSGSRVPLNERSQIQIASRTFHFVLPPPPPLDTTPPEDSPSPATSHSSARRERSPSVDITSISPDSSPPSDSPPPPKPPDGQPAIASNSAAAGTSKPRLIAPTSKKRKKSNTDVLVVKPEVMPPKPPLTYAQMCHRAIKATGGKATLQDIIAWMIDSFDWYKYNVGSGWESSVRHNLSSGKAFKKMERSTGERGKGFYWSIDENFEHIILEQDAKLLTNQSAAVSKDGKGSNKKAKGPLPPPLTSAPLAMKSSAAASSMSTFRAHPPPVTTATVVKSESSTQSLPSLMDTAAGASVSAPIPKAETSGTSSALIPPIAPLIPSSVRIPIIVGPVPASHVPSSTTELSSSTSPHLPTPPIVLHENTLILNPTIFGHLTADQLKGLETLGAQKALEILQGYIVRFLKERIRTEGGRGRGRGNGVRGRGRGMRGGSGCTGRGGKNVSVAHIQNAAVTDVVSEPVSVSVLSHEMPSAPAPSGGADQDIVINIMDDDDDDERTSKRRRLEEPLTVASAEYPI